jgi:hypothetical protein
MLSYNRRHHPFYRQMMIDPSYHTIADTILSTDRRWQTHAIIRSQTPPFLQTDDDRPMLSYDRRHHPFYRQTMTDPCYHTIADTILSTDRRWQTHIIRSQNSCSHIQTEGNKQNICKRIMRVQYSNYFHDWPPGSNSILSYNSSQIKRDQVPTSGLPILLLTMAPSPSSVSTLGTHCVTVFEVIIVWCGYLWSHSAIHKNKTTYCLPIVYSYTRGHRD